MTGRLHSNNPIWWLAETTEQQSRQPSFAPAGARPSISYRWFGFGWSREQGCFVKGFRYDLNPMKIDSKACDSRVARAMLVWCSTKQVRERFLRNTYASSDDSDIFAVADTMFGLELEKSRRVDGIGLIPAKVCLSFYSPEWKRQNMYLHDGMARSLGQTLTGKSALEIHRLTQ